MPAAALLALAAALAWPAGVRAGEARLAMAEGATAPGTVRLALAPAQEGDPAGSVRLEMVLQGPLEGEGAEDLFAFNAVLQVPAPEVTFVGNSVRKGDLLGLDGANWLVTAAASPGSGKEITIGGSRMGAIPGIAAPAGSSVLCSFALQVTGTGPYVLEWQDAAFIDSSIRRLEVVRFAGATLQPAGEAQTDPAEEAP